MTQRRTAPTLTDAEEAQIQARIAADPDSPELTDAQIAELRPASEVLPPELFASLTRRGRPKSEHSKVLVTLRLDPRLLAGYQAGGPGWQVRMGEVLAAGLPAEQQPTPAAAKVRSGRIVNSMLKKNLSGEAGKKAGKKAGCIVHARYHAIDGRYQETGKAGSPEVKGSRRPGKQSA